MTKECKDKGDTCTLSETGPNMTSVHGDVCVQKECHEQADAEKETARLGKTACRSSIVIFPLLSYTKLRRTADGSLDRTLLNSAPFGKTTSARQHLTPSLRIS